ncbi:MAG: hypothetical protein AB8G23_14745 [Myxococcota bacterium]
MSAHNTENESSESEYWLDQPENVNKLIYALIAAAAAAVFADLFYHKHAYFHFMEYFAFDAAFGFAAYVGLVTTAKGLRKLIMRDEDYYGDLTAQAEADAAAAAAPSGGHGDEEGHHA